MSVAIRLEACGKTWPGGSVALHRLDLDIAAGETLVLLGPSGCGKTTLLRLIAGLESPDAGGRVFFDGEDVTRLPIERRNVGMVFQSYALFPNMDVAGNIGYGLRVRGVARAEARRRVDEMLEMMRLTELGGRRIDALSGGQRQRVALARAIAPRPRVLLLDEPLSALDARLREQLRLEIDELLRGLGITAIYVTHDQAEAMALGDRICAMDRGRIAQIGTGRDLYHRPANDFVAGFVGDTNRLATPDGERLVRPEQLTLRPCDNGAFTVLRTTFLGPFVRVLLRDAGGRAVQVDMRDEDVPALGARGEVQLRNSAQAAPSTRQPSNVQASD